MPFVLRDEDLDVWLGEQRASLDDVIDLIHTFESDDIWETSVEDPSKKLPRPRKPKSPQADFL